MTEESRDKANETLAVIIESGTTQSFDIWQKTVFQDHAALIDAGVPGAREDAYKALIEFLIKRQEEVVSGLPDLIENGINSQTNTSDKLYLMKLAEDFQLKAQLQLEYYQSLSVDLTSDSTKALAKALGPAFDGVQLYQAFSTGNSTEIVETVYEVGVGTIVGTWISGFIARSTARTLSAAILGGIVTGGVGLVAGLIAAEIWERAAGGKYKEEVNRVLSETYASFKEFLETEHSVPTSVSDYSFVESNEYGLLQATVRLIDPSFENDDIRKLIKSFDNETSGAFVGTELGIAKLVYELEQLIFGAQGPEFFAEGEFFTRVAALANTLAGEGALSNASIAPLFNLSADNLVGLAKSDPKYLRAIIENIPFVIKGADHLYVQFDGQEIYDISNYSDNYINDRADFFKNLMDINYINGNIDSYEFEAQQVIDLENGISIRTEVVPVSDFDGDYLYINEDLTIDESMEAIIFGKSEEQNHLTGTDYDDRLYGGTKNDILSGGEGNDYLEGGEDYDALYGGKDDDTLLGGEGDDNYYYDTGDGHDTIIDSDGLGSIIVNGQALTGGKRVNDESLTYRDDEQGVTYTLVGYDLRISFDDGGGSITIKDYELITQQNALGITLDGAIIDAPQIADSSNLILNQSHEQPYSDGSTYYRYSPTADAEGDASINQTISGELDLRMSVIGSNGDTTIHGSSLGDSLAGDNWFYDPVYGSAQNFGDDVLYGYGGDDSLEGFWGNDWLEGGDGNDYLLDDIGYNQIFIESQTLDEWNQILPGNSDDVLIGGSGDDQLEASRGNDRLDGGIGNDTLYAGAGDDIALGGAGDDVIFTDAYWAYSWTESSRTKYNLDATDAIGGNDFVDAGAGADLVFAGTGDDHIYGGEGDDKLYGDGDLSSDAAGWTALNQGDDTIYGGAGADRIYGMGGNDNLHGGDGDDEIHGDRLVDMNGVALDESLHGNDNITGGLGNDTIFSHGGDDTVYGDQGTDTILTGKGNDIAYGGTEDDQIYLDEGNDFGYGGSGNDTVDGGSGNDVLFGDSGSDELAGGLGDDVLDGGADNDNLWGHEGSDSLMGGSGNDYLDGGDGDDRIQGGAGTDHIYAGEGNDTIVFNIGDGTDAFYSAGGSNTLEFGAGITIEDLQIVKNTYGEYNLIYSDSNDFINFKDDSLLNISTIRFSDGNEISLADLLTADGESAPYVYNPQTITVDSSVDVSKLNFKKVNNHTIIGHDDGSLSWTDNADYYSWVKVFTGSELSELYPDLAFNDGSYLVLLNSPGFRYVSNGSDSVNIWTSTVDAYTYGSSLDDTIDGNLTEDNIIYSEGGSDSITTGSGADWVDSGEGNDFVNSGSGDDYLIAGDGSDFIETEDGNDTIYGGSGNDIIDSGAGDDFVDGGQGTDFIADPLGNDTYFFNLGDGTNHINDLSGLDKLVLGEGISQSDLIFEDINGALTISISGTNDKIYLYGWNEIDRRIETIELSDGTILNPTDINNLKINSVSPHQVQDLYNQSMVAGELFSYTIPDNAFSHLSLETLNFDIKQSNGSALPSWLTFDEVTKTLTGTPPSDVNSLELSVVVTSDDGLSVADKFTLDLYAVHNLIVSEDTQYIPNDNNYIVYGTDGNDRASVSSGSSVSYEFYMGDGDDYLSTGYSSAQSLVHLGVGNDHLSASNGEDILFFNLGDNDDTFGGAGEEDSVVFGENISPDDLVVSLGSDNRSIVLNHINGSDSLTVSYWFYTNFENRVGKFSFSNGETWTADYITNLLENQIGTDYGDELFIPYTGGNVEAGAGDDYIYFNEGNGTASIDAGSGNDNIIVTGYNSISDITAGSGSDYIELENGRHTVYFNLGDGSDTINASTVREANIHVTSSINFNDVSFVRNGLDLVISHSNQLDSITIKDWFDYESNQIDNIYFESNDTQYAISEFITPEMGYSYQGTDADDLIVGGGMDEEFEGGLGNDTIEIGSGDAAVHYSMGDGQDVIVDLNNSGNRTIDFSNGISIQDISYQIVDKFHLKINLSDGGSILWENWFLNGNTNFNIQLSDGTTIDRNHILGLVLEPNMRWSSSSNYESNVIKYFHGGGSVTDYSNADNTYILGTAGGAISGGSGNETFINSVVTGAWNEYGYGIGGTAIGYEGDDHFINFSTYGALAYSSSLERNYGNDTFESDLKYYDNQTITYIFNYASGQDTVIRNVDDNGVSDKESILQINFFRSNIYSQQPITFYELNVERVGDDLVVKAYTPNDSITFTNWFLHDDNKIDTVVMQNGNVYTGDDLEQLALQPNTPPEVVYEINDIIWIQGVDFNHQINPNTFNDAESGNELIYRGYGYHPGILFDSDTLSYSGIAPISDTSTSPSFSINAFDPRGNFTSANFKIEFINVSNIIKGSESGEVINGSRNDDGIVAYGGDDTIYADSKNDVVFGGDGNDTIYGGTGDDLLFGDAGNDVINGEGNDDTIFGGKGDDLLTGGKGSDTFVYHLGDGNDVIDAYYNEKNAVDRLQFGKNISTDNVSYTQNGQDLIITILSTSETITVTDWFKGSTYELGEIQFSDGTIHTSSDVGFMLSNAAQSNMLNGYISHEVEDSAYEYKQNPDWRLAIESSFVQLEDKQATSLSTDSNTEFQSKLESNSIKLDPKNIMMVPNKNPEGMFVDGIDDGLRSKVLNEVLVPNKSPGGMLEDTDDSGKHGIATDVLMVPNKSPEGMFTDEVYGKLFDVEGDFVSNTVFDSLNTNNSAGDINYKQQKQLQLMIQEVSFTINDNESSELCVNSSHEENYHSSITLPL